MAIDQKINTDVITIPLYYQPLRVVESKRLNRNGHEYGNEQFNYDWSVQDWTIEPDADGKKLMYTNAGPHDNYFPVPWVDLGFWASNKLTFDHLLYAKGDLSGIAGGDLADKWTVSPDGLTVTFTLRDGVTWQDGTPITVDDVAWSIEAALKYPTLHGVVANTFNSIEGAADYLAGKAEHVSGIATDGKTITLKMAKLDANVLATFAQFAPLPKAQFVGVDPTLLQQAPYWQHPIGSGPFKIEDAKFGDYTSFVPYDGYWGGKAKIDQIIAFASQDGDPNLVKNVMAHRFDFGITKVTADVKALKDLDFIRMTPLNIPYTRMIWINQYDK
jgi:peptide/nickel transport system substrate-binding protein